jgi:Flp pilus assembly protein TadD
MSTTASLRSVGVVGVLLVCLASAGCQTAKQKQAQVLMEKASESFAAGDFRKNADFLKQAAEADPKNPIIWARLCEAYQLTEELDLAVKACEQNLNLEEAEMAYNSLGLVYLAKKDYTQAASAFEKAAAQSRVSAVHQNLVWALLGSKQFDKAVPAAQLLVELSKGDAPELNSTTDAYELLGIAYLGVGQKEKAREAFGKAHMNSCSMGTDEKGDLVVKCEGN